jgi:glycine/D-amino acid oxidase-like deaminating enzyme
VKTHPYWWDTVEPQAPSPKPHAPSTADVAIIGAGYTGLSAARTLARAGATVVVLERERAGWGASSRNGGQVLAGLKIDALSLVDRYGEARAHDVFAEATKASAYLESLIAAESIACDYARVGHLQAAWKASHLDAFRREQALLARVFDHPVHVVGRAEQAAEIGSTRYHGVLVDETSAAINPAKYVHGLAGAARRGGVTILEHTPADEIRRVGKRWSVISGPLTIDAGDVLLATNGYTDGAAPALQRRLLPRRRMAFDSKNFLYYFRVTDDRRLLFGGRAEFGTADQLSTTRAAALLHRGMVDVFPQLAGVEVEYAWSGNVAFTRDEMPRAGRLDGLYYAGGYCGHGIAMATYLGDQIARRIAGEPMVNPLFDDRFAAIPLYSGTPWFLPLVGAYYQVKDWLQ